MFKIWHYIKVIFDMTKKSLRSFEDINVYNASVEYMNMYYKYSKELHAKWDKEGLKKDKNCPICDSEDKEFFLNRDIIGNSFYKCKHCSFVYQNPFVDKEYYDEMYLSSYGGAGAWWENKKIELGISQQDVKEYRPIEEIKKFKDNGKLIDFGCGTGWVTKIASKYYDAYGIDIDEERLKLARSINQDNKIYNGMEYDEELNEKFDIVHTNQNIEHLLNPRFFLKKFHNWLKKDGIVYIAAPSWESFAFEFLKDKNQMGSLGHVSLFNYDSLKYALEKEGFKILSYRNFELDVSATEFWKQIFGMDFLHRHNYVKSNAQYILLFPFMFVTTGVLQLLHRTGLLKGNYYYVICKKI